MATSTAPAVVAALKATGTGVDLSGFTSPTVVQLPAPPKNPLTANDGLVWAGVEKGGREGGQQSLTTSTALADDSTGKWSRLESYLIKGQAIALRSFTSDEVTPADNARIRAYAIAGQVEKWVRANRTAAGALEIEMESIELALSNITVSTTDYKQATVTMSIRVHSLI